VSGQLSPDEELRIAQVGLRDAIAARAAALGAVDRGDAAGQIALAATDGWLQAAAAIERSAQRAVYIAEWRADRARARKNLAAKVQGRPAQP